MEDSSIKIPRRLLILFISFVVCFFYFNEKFSKPEFRGYVHKIFKPVLGNDTNHTLVKMIDKNTGLVSVGLSTSAVTLISYFPVFFRLNFKFYLILFLKKKFITEPRNVVYGLLATGALGVAKYKLDLIDWGFFSIKKYFPSNSENPAVKAEKPKEN